MTKPIAKLSEEQWTVVALVAALSALVIAYIALCLVVLYRPEWLATRSIFYAAVVGPPNWLAWGHWDPMFWGSTLAIAAVAALGAKFPSLAPPSAGLCVLIWLGSGFLSVAMSV